MSQTFAFHQFSLLKKKSPDVEQIIKTERSARFRASFVYFTISSSAVQRSITRFLFPRSTCWPDLEKETVLAIPLEVKQLTGQAQASCETLDSSSMLTPLLAARMATRNNGSYEMNWSHISHLEFFSPAPFANRCT